MIAFLTLLNREIDRFLRVWPETLLPPVITMSLYFTIFGKLIGNRIGTMSDVHFIEYIAPGLIILSMITNSYINTTFSMFITRFFKNIQEMLVAPMSSATLILGFVVGGILRGLAIGSLVLVVATLFHATHFQHPLLIVVVMVLATSLFSLIGFLNGLLATKFDQLAIIPNFIITPLTYLGGIFYTVGMLPNFWQKVEYFNPILYLVNAMRYAMIGITDVPVATALWVTVGCIVAVFLLNFYLVEHGVRIKE